MWQFIWLGVISFLVMSLLIFNHFMKESREGFADTKASETPKDYTLDIVKSTKISQPPFPPCVGYVDEVVYAPSDVNANIVQIKPTLSQISQIPSQTITSYHNNGIISSHWHHIITSHPSQTSHNIIIFVQHSSNIAHLIISINYYAKQCKCHKHPHFTMPNNNNIKPIILIYGQIA